MEKKNGFFKKKKNLKEFNLACKEFMKSDEGRKLFRDHKTTVKVQRTKRSVTSMLVKVPRKMKRNSETLRHYLKLKFVKNSKIHKRPVGKPISIRKKKISLKKKLQEEKKKENDKKKVIAHELHQKIRKLERKPVRKPKRIVKIVYKSAPRAVIVINRKKHTHKKRKFVHKTKKVISIKKRPHVKKALKHLTKQKKILKKKKKMLKQAKNDKKKNLCSKIFS